MKAKFIKDWVNDMVDRIMPSSTGDGESILKSMESLLLIGLVIGIGVFVVVVLGVAVKYVPV